MGLEPTRLPRIALPLDTDVTPVRTGRETGSYSGEPKPRDPTDRTARQSLRRPKRLRKAYSRSLDDLQPKPQADDAGEPDDAHQDRIAVEVLLRHGGAGHAGRDTAAEQA